MAKGQIFLIIGVITVVIIAMLRTSLDMTNTIEEKNRMELGMENQQFGNIENEILKSAEIGYNDSGNMTQNVQDFFRYARNSLKANTVELNGLFVMSYFPYVASGANTELNVTVANFLGLNLMNLTLNFNSDSRIFASVADGSSVSAGFTFNSVSDYNYTLSVNYLSSYENVTKNVTIPVRIGKSSYIGFCNLRLASSRLDLRDEFSQIYNMFQ